MKNVFLFVICLFGLQVLKAQTEKPELIKVGDKSPAFTIETLDGKIFNSEKLTGKVIYLNFFATWCGPCIKELPHVEEKIWKAIKNDDFVMLVIGREHTPAEMEAFLKSKGFTFPIAPDPNREVYSKFAHQNIPRNVLIDKTGTIVYSQFGYTEAGFAELIQTINKSLE